ncbi:MAG: LIC12162 family protein, partial [Pseudomonadota bacterium]
VLPQLGARLNEIHETRHGPRYWRIVLGPWLQVYLSALYDRYRHLKQALEEYPDCTTIGLSVDSFTVPFDTLDFISSLKEDPLNLQLCTKILSTLGKTFPTKSRPHHRGSWYGILARRSWIDRAIAIPFRVYARAGVKGSRSIVIRSSYFSKTSAVRLLIRGAGTLLPVLAPLTKVPVLSCDEDIRKRLAGIDVAEGEFGRCLSVMLPTDIPLCFVEGFGYVRNDAQNLYPKSSKAVFTANAWYYDEAFKQWSGAAAERGVRLLGTQHGGNYGGLANVQGEDHETTIVDRYYTWGWQRNDCAAEVVAFPATKLTGRRRRDGRVRTGGILWGTTSSPRYLIQFPVLPEFTREYLAWQERFLKGIPGRLLNELRVRPHREDCDWGLLDRLRECVPWIVVEGWSVPFEKSFERCRLYVCDHLSTTFVEALSANQPTLLFWDPRSNRLRPEARPYYDMLREGGVLLDTPEAAAESVARVYDDAESWWNDPERQRLVAGFRERFARHSSDDIRIWTEEFDRIAGEPCFTTRP